MQARHTQPQREAAREKLFYWREQCAGADEEGMSTVQTSATPVLSGLNGNSLSVTTVEQLLQAIQNPNVVKEGAGEKG
jgi:hypothetical protein